jgi:UMP-CMP kinase
MKNDIAMNGCRRYLIDGFPRNEENLKVFQEVMKDSVEVKKLIFFNCSSQVMSERIMERAKVSGRVDDNPESIKKRLDVYEQDTIPMV